MSVARRVAFSVLQKVNEGGYASDVLAEESSQLDSRDAGLASEIVFGCLRRQAQLDFLIGYFAQRDLKLDPEVRIALRISIYQLRHLDRVPQHAAVSEGVELVKKARRRSAAGLVNAVLRKVTKAPVSWPDDSTAYSCPAWLLDKWAKQWDRQTARGIAEAALEQPETWIRTTSTAENLEPSDLPGCSRLAYGSAPPCARIQDIGSQSIVPLLELRPGARFLDLCAAPGNKTAQALETPVHAIACDLHWRRIQSMRDVGADLLVLDATRPLPFARPFDRILVDAPCTGTGTLARNPESKWRMQPSDPARLAEVQVRILGRALALLVPGGRLVYSTCSLEREENEQVVATVLGNNPKFRIAQKRYRIPGRDPGDGFFVAAIEFPG